MRFFALCLTSVLVAGCAGGSESVGSNSQEVGVGSCRVMYDDEDMVMFRTSEGERLVAPKRLHIVDVRMTQGQRPSDELKGTRFWNSHLEYVFAPKISEESLMKIGNMIGETMPEAPLTITADTASVQTSTMATSARFTTEGANLVADLSDATDGASPILNGAIRKSFLKSATVKANAACGGGSLAITMVTDATPAFDVAKAKVFQPKTDVSALNQFLVTANAIRRGDRYRDPLTKVGPEVAAKLTEFADLVDRDIRPLANTYGNGAGREDLQAKMQTAWAAYLDVAQTVLVATNASVGVDTMFVRNNDGSYRMNTDTPALANELLPGADTFRGQVETVLAERGSVWAERALQP